MTLFSQDFLNGFRVTGAVDRAQSRFDFRIAIPKECEDVVAVRIGDGSLEPFATLRRYQVPQSGGLELAVRMSILPREVSAGDFLECAALGSGRKVVQRRDWEGFDGCQCEIFEEFEEGGETWLRRTRGIKDGPRLFRIDATALKSRFAATEEMVAISLLSFQLLHSENQASAEELVKFVRAEPTPVVFKHPVSWQVVEENISPEALELRLEDAGGTADFGILWVWVYPTGRERTAPKCMRLFAETLRHRGARINGAPIIPKQPRPGFLATHVYAPTATRDGADLSVGAVVFESSNAISLVGVMGPGRTESPWCWAVTKRFFEVLHDSLRVETGAIQ